MAKKIIKKTDKIATPKELAHLEGLHDYFLSTSKKELNPYVEKAMEKLKELDVTEQLLNHWEEMEEKYNSLSDKPKDFNESMLLAGTIISQLNYQLNNNK